MATDYVTSPMSRGGMLLYGVLIGLITILIRLFGAYPEGISFAILFMNGIVPMTNRYNAKPKLFGEKPKSYPKHTHKHMKKLSSTLPNMLLSLTIISGEWRLYFY